MSDLFKPVSSILSWETKDETTRSELCSYGEAINKLVSIGTHLLEWELRGDIDASVFEDEVVQVGVSFKRLLEILDSISLQVKVGAVSTAVIQLRVLFELSVQFEYLLMADTQKRCYCMIITDWYRRLEDLNKIPIEKQSSEEKDSINHLNRLINVPELALVRADYDKLRINKRSGEIKWYNLIDSLLGDFSKLVSQKFSKYDLYYKAINKGFGNDAVHSTNLLRGNFIHQDGVPAIVQMRNSREAVGVAGIAFSIGKTCCEIFVKRRNKENQSKYISAIMQCEKIHKDIAFAGLYKLNRK